METPEEQYEKSMKFNELLLKMHNSALTNLLKNKDFRFYMSELLGFCKTFESAFSEKGNVAAYNNGMQAVGQKIFNDIMSVDRESYIQMCKEEEGILAIRNQYKGD